MSEKTTKDTHLYLRIDEETKNQAFELAERNGISVSQLVRLLIADTYKNKASVVFGVFDVKDFKRSLSVNKIKAR